MSWLGTEVSESCETGEQSPLQVRQTVDGDGDGGGRAGCPKDTEGERAGRSQSLRRVCVVVFSHVPVAGTRNKESCEGFMSRVLAPTPAPGQSGAPA